MSKFVVLNPQGEVLKSNASAKEAAEVVLGYDGHEWEIRPGHHNIGYTLFVSKFSRNSACYDSRLIEIVHANGNSMEEIEEKIFQEVCHEQSIWNDCTIIGQDQYDASMAENEED